MFALKTILHPTDFSPRSQQAFAAACSLARDRGAKLVLVHVVERPIMMASGVMMPPPPPPPDEEIRQAWEQFKTLQPPDPSISLEHQVLVGDAAQAILETAKQTKADLIVMGTHGRTGLSRLLMGSIAENVVRNATCPVLTLKTPG